MLSSTRAVAAMRSIILTDRVAPEMLSTVLSSLAPASLAIDQHPGGIDAAVLDDETGGGQLIADLADVIEDPGAAAIGFPVAKLRLRIGATESGTELALRRSIEHQHLGRRRRAAEDFGQEGSRRLEGRPQIGGSAERRQHQAREEAADSPQQRTARYGFQTSDEVRNGKLDVSVSVGHDLWFFIFSGVHGYVDRLIPFDACRPFSTEIRLQKARTLPTSAESGQTGFNDA